MVITVPRVVFVLQETEKLMRLVILNRKLRTYSYQKKTQQTLKDCLGEFKTHIQVIVLGEGVFFVGVLECGYWELCDHYKVTFKSTKQKYLE